ncbi:MAG: WD40 repeat domain-containing protein [bacterium]|nr:WD40 repeat domain-containing protein [bacterium]
MTTYRHHLLRVLLGLACACGTSAAASFLEPLLAGPQPPLATTTQLAGALDADPDALLHAQLITRFVMTNGTPALLAFFVARGDAGNVFDGSLRQFDLALAQTLTGIRTDAQDLVSRGVDALAALCQKNDNAVFWLTYGLCLAQVDLDVIGRSRFTMSPMKETAMQAVTRALDLQLRFPQRDFGPALHQAITCFAAYPVYEKFAAQLRIRVLPALTPAAYWNGLLLLRGDEPQLGYDALVARTARTAYLLNFATWSCVLHLQGFDDYGMCANGTLLAVRQSGALPVYATRTGKRVARLPRVQEWTVATDSSIGVIRNPGTPANIYDFDVADFSSGEVLATLYRACARAVRVYGVAVTRDYALAAVHYQVPPDVAHVDVWDVRTGRLLGTLTNPGGLPVSWSPDNHTLLRSATPTEYSLCNVRVLNGATESPYPPAKQEPRLHLPMPYPRAAFLQKGAALLCWNDERSGCDGFGLYDTATGAVLAQSSNQWDGIAVVDDGPWFVVWRDTALRLYAARPAARGTVALSTNVPAPITAAALAHNGDMLAVATRAGVVYQWCLNGDARLALAPLATHDPGLSLLAYEEENRFVAAHSSSSQYIYVAALQAGGMFDDFSVLGWVPMTHPPLDVQALLRPPVRRASRTAPATPRSEEPFEQSVIQFQNLDRVSYADLNRDGAADAIAVGTGTLLALPTNTLYLLDGVRAVPPAGSTNARPYAAVFYRAADQWLPVLVAEYAACGTGAVPLVVTAMAFTNPPLTCLALQSAGRDARATLNVFAGAPSNLTVMLAVTNAPPGLRVQHDADTALLSLAQPLVTPFQAFPAQAAGIDYHLEYSIDGMLARPVSETLQVTPAFTLSVSNATRTARALCVQQAALLRGKGRWRATPQAYATRLFPALTPFVLESTGKGTAVLRSAMLGSGDARVFLYQPFYAQGGSSVWHHALAAPLPADAAALDALYAPAAR